MPQTTNCSPVSDSTTAPWQTGNPSGTWVPVGVFAPDYGLTVGFNTPTEYCDLNDAGITEQPLSVAFDLGAVATGGRMYGVSLISLGKLASVGGYTKFKPFFRATSIGLAHYA